MPFWNARSWRGPDGEDEMTKADWTKRGLEQAMAMREAGSWEDANPDEEGVKTAGYYNGDYPQSWHDECNRRLEQDEYFEAETEQSIWTLFRADNTRREGEDSE